MLFAKEFFKTQEHEALLISSAANCYPLYILHWWYLQFCSCLNPSVTTLTTALDSFLAQALRLLQGQGEAVELFMVSGQTTKSTAQLPAGSVYTFLWKPDQLQPSLLAVLRKVWLYQPTEAIKPNTQPWTAFSCQQRGLKTNTTQTCKSCMPAGQGCKMHVFWRLMLVFYGSKEKKGDCWIHRHQCRLLQGL